MTEGEASDLGGDDRDMFEGVATNRLVLRQDDPATSSRFTQPFRVGSVSCKVRRMLLDLESSSAQGKYDLPPE